MAVPPANHAPAISPAEMQILVSRTGLMLNPGQLADLVLAWRQVAGLIGSLPRERPFADDMAMGFHVAPPAVPPRPSRGPAATAAKPMAKAAKTPARATAASKAGAKPVTAKPKPMAKGPAAASARTAAKAARPRPKPAPRTTKR
jgi:hypothetical protein